MPQTSAVLNGILHGLTLNATALMVPQGDSPAPANGSLSKIATVLQRLFVVLIHYVYLHLSQKTVNYEKDSVYPVIVADANIFHHGVCSE